MIEDLSYAWMAIRRNPLLTLASIATLTLGIGLNAGVFTVLDGLLFRARVEKDPATFVHLSPGYTGEAAQSAGIPWALSTRDYRTFAAESRTLRELAAWSVVRLRLAENSEPVLSLMVTSNFFDVYGLGRMLMGRTFHEDAPEAVISEELWQSRFGSDPHILGKMVGVNAVGVNIVGITPAGFSGRIRGPGLWVPWTMQPALSSGENWLVDDGRTLAHG